MKDYSYLIETVTGLIQSLESQDDEIALELDEHNLFDEKVGKEYIKAQAKLEELKKILNKVAEMAIDLD